MASTMKKDNNHNGSDVNEEGNKMSSLRDIMNDMIACPERLEEHLCTEQVVRTRFDAWTAIDPLLADLYKQFLDAQSYHRKVAKRHGAADPMATVAADMTDSAGSAFQTRLLEIRRDRSLRRRVLALLRDVRRRKTKEKRDALQALYRQQGLIHDKRKAAEDSFNLAVFLWWMLYFVLENTRRTLSLANDFAQASHAPHGYDHQTEAA